MSSLPCVRINEFNDMILVYYFKKVTRLYLVITLIFIFSFARMNRISDYMRGVEIAYNLNQLIVSI